MIGQRTSLLVLLLAGGLTACSGSQPVELPPQSLNQAAERGYGDDIVQSATQEEDDAAALDAGASPASQEVENQEEKQNSESTVAVDEVASAAPEPVAPTAEAQRSRNGTLVIIGEKDDDTPESANPLLAASLAERKRRRTAPAAVAVINDKNLAEFAAGGNLTYTTDTEPASGADSQDVAAQQARAEEELYWRTRVRSLRAQWRENTDLVAELEQQAEGLRRDFYAEDDPYVRDRRIKPEWDRTLDRLEEARRGVERSREDLLTALEEGRRAGALPGWLRDGVELEPKPVPREEMPEVDPEEPQVVDP